MRLVWYKNNTIFRNAQWNSIFVVLQLVHLIEWYLCFREDHAHYYHLVLPLTRLAVWLTDRLPSMSHREPTSHLLWICENGKVIWVGDAKSVWTQVDK